MQATYRVLAILVPVLVALQTAFIAMAVFGLFSWVDDGNDVTKSVLESDSSSITGSSGFALHAIGAMALVVVAVLLLVVSFLAKIPGGVRSAALVLGAVVLQWVLAIVSFGAWPVGALHAINAFLVFGLGMMAAQRATRFMRGAPERTAAGQHV
jgi:uncharacterized membrane protein (Fun14 family)